MDGSPYSTQASLQSLEADRHQFELYLTSLDNKLDQAFRNEVEDDFEQKRRYTERPALIPSELNESKAVMITGCQSRTCFSSRS